MMKYRLVYTDFWNDPMVTEEMTPEERYFFLYLLTNPNTTHCGIYAITKKQIAFELGYSIEKVNILMDKFENRYKLIAYNAETRELAIKNWGKYNLNRGGKPVMDCLSSELAKVKDKSLIEYILQNIDKTEIKELYQSFCSRKTSSERYVPRQVDNTYTNTNTYTYTNTERGTYTFTNTNINTFTSTDTDTSMNEVLIMDSDESSKESIQSLSLPIIEKHERLIGEKGLLSSPSALIAVCQHGRSYVEKRGPT